ncbi:hypothetical protein ACKKBG_A17755 [Auxenochlorella protothecoides x Auxenochlorella symbiontica]
MHAQITADLSPYLKRTFRPCGTTTSPLPASRQFSMTEEGAYVDLDGDVELEGQLGEDQMDDIESMKARLEEMEREAAKLKEIQEKAQKDAGLVPGTSAPGTDANKEEADSRSVYVGSVDYAATPEELQSHFQGCGTVNRVTILSDKAGNPKGFAYIEFLEADAVSAACLLDGSELRGRTLKVNPKRTNVPGMRARGRGRGRGGAGGYMMPPPFMMPWMWGGYMPRGRGRGRGRGGYTPY